MTGRALLFMILFYKYSVDMGHIHILNSVLLIAFSVHVIGQFDWQIRDGFDEITSRMAKVKAENCRVVDRNALFLSKDSVTHIPNIRQIGIDPVLPNRTSLLQIHNMAMARAFFYRWVFPKLYYYYYTLKMLWVKLLHII